MNALRNRVQLIGHLGNDPQVKSFDNGNKVAKLTVATNSTYNNKAGERVQDTQWHNVVMWGKTADIAEKYLQKGQEVAIEGKLTTRSYDDKNGQKRYITEIIVNELVMLGRKEKAAA